MEFREHEEHFEELVLPLLIRGDLLPAEDRTLEDDLTLGDLDDLIPEDDLLRPEEL